MRKQIQEFCIYPNSSPITLSIPQDAKGVSVQYSTSMKSVVICFEVDPDNIINYVNRTFELKKSYETSENFNGTGQVRYCGSASVPASQDFGIMNAHVYHVWELY